MVRIYSGPPEEAESPTPGRRETASEGPSPAGPAGDRPAAPPRRLRARDVLVEPYGWVFRRLRPAFLFTLLFMPLTWMGLVLIRRWWAMERFIFWENELTILATFTGGGVFALVLGYLYARLESELVAMRPTIAPLLAELRRRLHHRTGLVWMPLGLAAVAIGIRYFSGDDFNPFGFWSFDTIFSVWLFMGFWFILHTTSLCARYTEIARVLGHEVAEGRLGQQEMKTLSRFYLKVAVIASFHFAACALSVYSLYIIYTYAGNMWQGYQLIRFKPGIPLLEQAIKAWNDPLFSEVAIFFALYGSVSIAPVVYFILPQWEVHQILVRRKETLLAKCRQMQAEAENRLGPKATAADLEEYARCASVAESVEKMPEWPFEMGGKLGTVFLLAIPSLLVLVKEVFLEAVLQILLK